MMVRTSNCDESSREDVSSEFVAIPTSYDLFITSTGCGSRKLKVIFH